MRYALTLILLTSFGCGQSSQTHTVEKPVIAEKTPDQIVAAQQLEEIREHQERLESERLDRDYREWMESLDSVADVEAEQSRLQRRVDAHIAIIKAVADGKLTQAAADEKIAAHAKEGRKEQAAIVAKYRGR